MYFNETKNSKNIKYIKIVSILDIDLKKTFKLFSFLRFASFLNHIFGKGENRPICIALGIYKKKLEAFLKLMSKSMEVLEESSKLLKPSLDLEIL